MRTNPLLVTLALAHASCASAPPPASPPSALSVVAAAPVSAKLELVPCTIPELARPARCGTAHVLEDRALGRGRTIPLKVVVVPATQAPASASPLVFITGGPGQAATDEAADFVDSFPKVAAARDLVFVDQRGMGRDSPLRCKLVDGLDVGRVASGDLPEARLRACLSSMDASPALYTTARAADDLDEVLRSLGYGPVDVMGVSYGTFAAQTFAHAHPERVRSLVLNGVVPPDAGFVLGFAPSAQAVLARTFDECAADAACHAAHPDPKAELERAFAKLTAHPERVTADGPGGVTLTFTLDRDAFALALRRPLYQAATRGRALSMIHDVAEGNVQRMGRALLNTMLALSAELSVGGYLSIACAESVSGVTMADAERASAGTFLGAARARSILEACRFWPKGAVPTWLHEPLEGDTPALLLGGTMDPATPLGGLEKAKAKLRHAQTVIVPGAGHDVGGACIDGVLASFLDHPLATIDTSCVKPIATRFEPTPVKVARETLDRYVGRYAVTPTFSLVVSREGDALFIQGTDQPKLPLDAQSDTRFFVQEVGMMIDLEAGPNGAVKRLVMHQGDRAVPAERLP